MEPNHLLNSLVGGNKLPSNSITDLPSDFDTLFLARMLSFYGRDNVALTHLGKHWKKLVRIYPNSPHLFRAGGIFERSNGRWLASAQAFLDSGLHSKHRIEKWSFQVGAIDSLARAGRIEQAIELANRIHRNLMRQKEPGLAARALLNLGNALVYQDRMVEARSVLKRALSLLDEQQMPLERASCLLAQSSAHLFGGHPSEAGRLAEQVLTLATSLEADYLVKLAQLNIAIVKIITGRSDDALEDLFKLKDAFDESPMDRSRVQEYLGDAYLRLNLWTEARESYEAAIDGVGNVTPLHRANLRLGMAQVELAMSNRAGAQTQFRTAAQLYRKIQNDPWVGACFVGIAQAVSNPGERQKLLQAALNLTKTSPFHQCLCLLERANPKDINRADALIKKRGYRFLGWRVSYLLAKAATNPRPHYRQMFKCILENRLSVRSLSSRMGFLRDKSDPIREYLDWLLRKPTKDRVDEALDVVLQSRSVTLLEEIASRENIPAEFFVRIAEIRESVSQVEADLPGTRRHGYRTIRGSGTLISQAIRSIGGTRPNSVQASNPVVMIESQSQIFAIHDRKLLDCRASVAELSQRLKWLSFELLAPMAEPTADHLEAESMLCDLGNMFKSVLQSNAQVLCLDGMLWRIPWTACSVIAGMEKEWSLCMHPNLGGSISQSLNPKSKVLILYGRSKDLPCAQREAEAIIDRFSNHRVATSVKEAQLALNESYDAVHVVSHAIHRADNPMFSSIEFEDGPLFATEIARSTLRVKLATLSACETGSVSLAMRDEPDGLARAFLARGASDVIASQWPLDDESAFQQFVIIYDLMTHGLSAQTALFRARCINRESKRHPYYWGALVLYTGY